MTDRHCEPYIAIDRSAEAPRSLPMPAELLPAPYPGEGVWARTAPLPAGACYIGLSGRRSGSAWLALICLAIGGSAVYLAYAAVVTPDLPARPAVIAAAAQTPDSLDLQLPLQQAAVVPPPLPREPTAPPRLAVTPASWAPVVVPRHPSHRHRLQKPVRARQVAARPARHLPRDTRHPLSWYASQSR